MEFEGEILHRDNRAKEWTLRKIIAEKDGVIAFLKSTIAERNAIIDDLLSVIEGQKTDIRNFKARKKYKPRRKQSHDQRISTIPGDGGN